MKTIIGVFRKYMVLIKFHSVKTFTAEKVNPEKRKYFAHLIEKKKLPEISAERMAMVKNFLEINEAKFYELN